MTNEELTVLNELIGDLLGARADARNHRNNTDALTGQLSAKSIMCERLRTENNCLLEREANAVNANEELKARCSELTAERDDARRKLFEWARFINFTVYTALDAAVKSKRCRPIVKDTVEAMLHFREQNPITLTEGGMAK